MSTQSSPALGSRENFWGDADIDELEDRPISEMSYRDLKRYVDHVTTHIVPTDRMDEDGLRSYARALREGGHDTQPSVAAHEVARWKAHQILRQSADKLSKTALHSPPDRGWSVAWCFVFEHLDGVHRVRDHDPMALHSERCEVELTEPTLHIPKSSGGQWGSVEYGQFRFRRRYDPEHGYIGGVSLDDLPIDEFLNIVEIVLGELKERHSFRTKRIEQWFSYAKELKQEPDMSDEDVLSEVLTEVYRDERTPVSRS